MSSATSLYAVDLDAVRRAVGSNEAAMRDRVLTAVTPPAPTGPMAVLTDDGGVTFNGVPMTPAVFAAEIRMPKWAGCRLLCDDQRSGRDPARRAAKSAELNAVLTAAMAEGVVTKLEWQPAKVEEDDEELSLKQAVTDLIAGNWTNDDGEQRYQYAYALEALCLTLSRSRLTVEGEQMLAHLAMNVPFVKLRSPVKLPRTADGPYISYLTAEEVRSEASRSAGVNPAFRDDPAIESDRREYARFVAGAAAGGHAVVAFYY